jgi:hypothetical protein
MATMLDISHSADSLEVCMVKIAVEEGIPEASWTAELSCCQERREKVVTKLLLDIKLLDKEQRKLACEIVSRTLDELQLRAQDAIKANGLEIAPCAKKVLQTVWSVIEEAAQLRHKTLISWNIVRKYRDRFFLKELAGMEERQSKRMPMNLPETGAFGKRGSGETLPTPGVRGPRESEGKQPQTAVSRNPTVSKRHEVDVDANPVPVSSAPACPDGGGMGWVTEQPELKKGVTSELGCNECQWEIARPRYC